MKSILLIALCLCASVASLNAADARVITENGTNILAIGIDSRDFSVVRFYLKGTNTLELRADQVLHREQSLKTEVTIEKQPERDGILDALRASTNVNALNLSLVVSNLARLQLLEDADARGKKKP